MFQTFPQRLSSGFQSAGNGANDGTNRDTSRKKDCCNCHAIFFEDLFDPLSKWKRSFSLFNLGSQPSELFLSFFNSPFCGFSFRRRSVLISENFPVSLNLLLKLSFLFLKVIERFCAVKAFFESISFSFFFRNLFSELSTVARSFAVFFYLFFKSCYLFFCIVKICFEIFSQLLQPAQFWLTLNCWALFNMKRINPCLRFVESCSPILPFLSSFFSFWRELFCLFELTFCFSQALPGFSYFFIILSNQRFSFWPEGFFELVCEFFEKTTSIFS